jgi:hypothetical protein
MQATGTYPIGLGLTLLANIILDWKAVSRTNTLAYFTTAPVKKRPNKPQHLPLASLMSYVIIGSSKTRNLPPPLAGSDLTCKYYTRLESLVRDKHTSLFCFSVSEEESKLARVFDPGEAPLFGYNYFLGKIRNRH